MTNRLASSINQLPAEIKREILYFIIPDPRTVRFSPNYPLYHSEFYSYKYDVAFLNNKILKNKNGGYLSRIAKKNGKHRYYLTTDVESLHCGECGDENVKHNRRCCKNRNIICDLSYKNNYLGKDMRLAFLELLRD